MKKILFSISILFILNSCSKDEEIIQQVQNTKTVKEVVYKYTWNGKKSTLVYSGNSSKMIIKSLKDDGTTDREIYEVNYNENINVLNSKDYDAGVSVVTENVLYDEKSRITQYNEENPSEPELYWETRNFTYNPDGSITSIGTPYNDISLRTYYRNESGRIYKEVGESGLSITTTEVFFDEENNVKQVVQTEDFKSSNLVYTTTIDYSYDNSNQFKHNFFWLPTTILGINNSILKTISLLNYAEQFNTKYVSTKTTKRKNINEDNVIFEKVDEELSYDREFDDVGYLLNEKVYSDGNLSYELEYIYE